MRADAQITFLSSSDLVASRVFYERALGLELAVDQGSCLIFRVTDAAFVGVCLRENVMPSPGAIFTIVTDDVDGWCDRIVGSGWTLDGPPDHSEQYGIYHAFLADPDGNIVEIQRFDDPDWAGGA